MLRSAVLKLTLAYLAILMALSIGFSLLLFRISSHELNEELRRPNTYELVQPGIFLDFNRFREMRLAQARSHLVGNLVVLNIGTLILGSLLSYGLAKRTIQPIEESLEAQSRFAADASHELRTPLTTLQTEIEVSLRDKKLSLKDAKSQLASSLEEVIKLKTLSDRLLRLARHDDEEVELKPTKLQPVIKNAIDQIAPLASNKNIKLIDKSKPKTIVANAQYLEDALVILLDNAVKYSSVNTKVTIETGQRNRQSFISVTDQGQGIKAKDLPHIFDRFYRADHSRSKNENNGHGLGLSIAQKLMDSQNGSIEAKSTVGKGSVFTMKLAEIGTKK